MMCKPYSKLFLFLLVGIFIVNLVSAIECGSTPTEDCTIGTGTTTFNTGTYYLNDTDSTGVIRITGSNAILDCNGSTLISNNTASSRGIYVNGVSNISIFNCNFVNYLYSINPTSTVNNITIANITTNNTDTGILIGGSTNWVIQNSTFYGQNVAGKQNIRITTNSKNGTIIYNNLYDTQYQINSLFGNDNITIQHNYLANSDIGSQLAGTNINFLNNTVFNTTNSLDGYDLGLKLSNCSNCRVEGNNFSIMASGGVYLQLSSNSTIKNNQFSFIPMSSRNLYSATDDDERPCAIIISPIYKTYIGGGVVGDDNSTELLKWIDNNITISGNTFDSNTQCYLKNMGGTNINHDITGWYRKFTSPVNILLPEEYYFNTNFQNISQFNASRIVTTFMRNTLRGSNGYEIMLQLFQSNSYFKNIHATATYQTNLYNLTNSLIQYDNGTSIPVYGTNQEINLTLAPSQYIYVYTNTTTVCDEDNSTCYMNVTNYNANFNETDDNLLNLTFTDSDDNADSKWYSWFVDGVMKLWGYGENVFTYIFHPTLEDPSIEVTKEKQTVNGSVICYQETATTSTACGGLNTGNYSFEGYFTDTSITAFAKDGAWNSYVNLNFEGNPTNMSVNYTLPSGTLNATLQMKILLTTANYTIPESCILNPLQLKLYYTDKFYLSCYNGSSLQIIFNTTSGQLYEEAMFWNLTTVESKETQTITITETIESPSITLNYPPALIDYGRINGTLQLNLTATDTNLDSVWYNYNGTNVSIAGAVSGVYNISNITLSSKKNVTIYANDTAGNLNATTIGWDYKVFENSRTYDESVLATSTESFILNLSIGSFTSIVGNLIYNGTSYSSTIATGDYVTLTNSLSIPAVSTDTNVSLYWNIVLDGTTEINTSATNQTVNPISFAKCGGDYNIPVINFTTRSASNPFPLANATFKTAWKLSATEGGTESEYNFEDITETNSSFAFCSEFNDSIYANAEIEYDGTDYALNFYYLDDAELTNVTQNITLYLLNDSKATVTTLSVKDDAQYPVEDVTIQIQFYDVGTGAFYLVGMAKTDFKGEDIVYLNWYDSLYKFILIQNGVVIKTTGNTKISSTPLTFNVLDEPEFLYKKFQDFLYTFYFNNETNNFVLTFTKPSGLVDQGCLRVIKRTSLNDTEICFDCESSSSATLFCNLNSAGNGTFIAHFYATGSWYDLEWITHKVGLSFSQEIHELLDEDDASFYAFIFAGIVTFMMFIHPIFGILGALLGVLGASALGFTSLDYGIFMGMALIGGILIWIIKR